MHLGYLSPGVSSEYLLQTIARYLIVPRNPTKEYCCASIVHFPLFLWWDTAWTSPPVEPFQAHSGNPRRRPDLLTPAFFLAGILKTRWRIQSPHTFYKYSRECVGRFWKDVSGTPLPKDPLQVVQMISEVLKWACRLPKMAHTLQNRFEEPK